MCFIGTEPIYIINRFSPLDVSGIDNLEMTIQDDRPIGKEYLLDIMPSLK